MSDILDELASANEDSESFLADRMVGTKEAADILGVSVATLYRWSAQGRGPKKFQASKKGKCQYRISDLAEFVRGD